MKNLLYLSITFCNFGNLALKRVLGGGGSREGGIGVESLIIGMGDEGHICFLSLIELN